MTGRQNANTPLSPAVPWWVVAGFRHSRCRNNMGGTVWDLAPDRPGAKNSVVPEGGRVRLRSSGKRSTTSKQPQHGPEAWLWNARPPGFQKGSEPAKNSRNEPNSQTTCQTSPERCPANARHPSTDPRPPGERALASGLVTTIGKKPYLLRVQAIRDLSSSRTVHTEQGLSVIHQRLATAAGGGGNKPLVQMLIIHGRHASPTSAFPNRIRAMLACTRRSTKTGCPRGSTP